MPDREESASVAELDDENSVIEESNDQLLADVPELASPDPAFNIAVGFAPRIRRIFTAPSDHSGAKGLTADGRLKSGKLAGLSMWSAIWVLCWPYVIESFLNSMVGITDTVLAAGVVSATNPDAGRHASDAIGAASYIMWLMGLVNMSVAMGATALVSRSIGKGRQAVADRTVAQTLLMVVACTSVVCVAFAVGAPWCARFFDFEPPARAMFVTYLRIICLAMPLLGLLFGGMACVRGAGDSKRPLIIMAVVNLINVVLSWILSGVDLKHAVREGDQIVSKVLIENPFPFDMGVAGVAWGTFGASVIGAGLMVGLLLVGKSGVTLRVRRLRPHRVMLVRLFRLGWPGFIEAMGMWIGNFIVVMMVSDLAHGANGVAGAVGAHMVAIRIEALSFMPGFAMGIAASALVGQYLGAGSAAMAQLAAVRCAALAVGVMGFLGVVFFCAPVAIVSVFTQVPEHIKVVPPLVVVFALGQIPFALSLVMRQVLRGAGDVRAAMLITWIMTYAARVPLVYLLSGVDFKLDRFGFDYVIENPFRDTPSLMMVWVALMSELALRSVFFTTRFMSGKWKTARV
ncbi:MAG: MATE family efflux transporter [Phycisphaeraceae bacterium]|nr:MATE family efflux transporter [Phycisphaerales bacterium]MCB9860828.1 MATE family efflux transporter [Phycisphaeraceae bacterium]